MSRSTLFRVDEISGQGDDGPDHRGSGRQAGEPAEDVQAQPAEQVQPLHLLLLPLRGLQLPHHGFPVLCHRLVNRSNRAGLTDAHYWQSKDLAILESQLAYLT